MGHTGHYVPDTGLIYIHGGYDKQRKQYSDLLAYNPTTHVWSTRSSGPIPQAFHSTAKLGALLLTFAGSETASRNCFGDKIAVYNISECM